MAKKQTQTITVPLTALMLPEGVEPTSAEIEGGMLVLHHVGADTLSATVTRAASGVQSIDYAKTPPAES